MVGCRGVVQVGGPGPGFAQGGCTKVGACKSNCIICLTKDLFIIKSCDIIFYDESIIHPCLFLIWIFNIGIHDHMLMQTAWHILVHVPNRPELWLYISMNVVHAGTLS